MPFEIDISGTFSAAHALRLPDGSVEPTHGHDFRVTLSFARNDGGLDGMDCVVDFHLLEAALEEVIGPWRSHHLNEIPPFDKAVNPSAERIAEQIGRNMKVPAGVRLLSVSITEAPGCVARWIAG